MADISVQKTGEQEEAETFSVVVQDGESREYSVTLTNEYYEKLTGGAIPPEELIRRSFAFLLEREPKEAILSSFDLSVIQTYFPEYESEIARNA